MIAKPSVPFTQIHMFYWCAMHTLCVVCDVSMSRMIYRPHFVIHQIERVVNDTRIVCLKVKIKFLHHFLDTTFSHTS